MATTTNLPQVCTHIIPLLDTAREVRAALKAAFPGVKFSVRCERYSGGSSIQVTWTDGPSQRAVERVAQQYEGSGPNGIDDSHAPRYFIRDGQRVRYMPDFVMCDQMRSGE